MQKKVAYIVLISIIFILAICFFMPKYYIGGNSFTENSKILINKIFMSFNNKEKLQEYTKAMILLIDRDFSKTNDYRLVLENNIDLYLLLANKFKAGYYKGFSLKEVRQHCFVYEATLENLQKEANVSLMEYGRKKLSSTEKCEENCKVYFTEKGLLLATEQYDCK